jgi:large subunit ribosomal protein L22
MGREKSKVESSVSVSRLRGARVSPQKARLIINMVRGESVAHALNILRFQKQKTARLAEKLIQSAVANAMDTRPERVDVDSLFVSEAYVDSGVTLKRSMPRARGSASPIRMRSSHITVVLSARNG